MEARAVPAQGAVVGDDAVAGDDDTDGVGGVGLAHGAGGAGWTERTGDVAVAARFAIRDREKRTPNALLVRGAFELEGEVEYAQLACEVKFELADSFAEHRLVVVLGPRGVHREMIEAEADESISGADEAQGKVGVGPCERVGEHAPSVSDSWARGAG